MRVRTIQAKAFPFIAMFLFLALTHGEPLYAVRVATPSVKMNTSKRMSDVDVVFTNESGELTGGDNSFCVIFQSIETGHSADVRSVSVDFRQLVGKMQEEPIKAPLTQDGVGHYCGHVNLGRQYYTPSSYYAVVRYADATGKVKKARLHVSVK